MVINAERLRAVAMGDEEFMRELIDLYLSDAPSQIELLSRAIGGKDLTAVGAVAHKLKGSCGNIGAEGLVALCQQLEAAGKANRVRELPGLLRQVQREFEDVNQALHQIKEGSSVAEGMRGKLA